MKKSDLYWVFTFIVPILPFGDEEEKTYKAMKENCVKGFVFECPKGLRVITVDATRRKAERLMWDLNGRNLRLLDTYTFNVLSDFVDIGVRCT